MSDAASSGMEGGGAPSGAAASSAAEAPVAGPAGGRGRRWSIRWRLIAALAGVSLFAVVVVGLIFYTFLSGYVVDQQQAKLMDQATVTSEQIQTVGALLPGTTVKTRAAVLFLRAGIRGLPAGAGMVLFQGDQTVAKAGILPVRAVNLDKLREAAVQASSAGPAAGTVKSALGTSARGVDLLYAAVPLTLSNGSDALLVTTLARSDALAAGSGLMRVLLFAAIIAVVVAIGVGWGLASWLARPLRRLSTATQGLAAGHFDVPVTGAYPGEVQELADSIETTRAEVARSQNSLRGFVAAAAHELRTPMTSIQGFSQALLDGTADDREQRQMAAAAIARESARLQKTLDALLTLSRYDSREFHPAPAPVAVDRLVEEEVDALVQAGLASAERIEVAADAGAVAVTDADMLRQVVGNLLRNAVQYGGDDPISVRVRQDAGRSGDGVHSPDSFVYVYVVSGGRPLTPEDRRRIFERFYRGKAARATEGVGLGLALCREICELLEGRIELVGDGPATQFRVSIPKSPRGRVLP
jgi:signal transduction histidine kinase